MTDAPKEKSTEHDDSAVSKDTNDDVKKTDETEAEADKADEPAVAVAAKADEKPKKKKAKKSSEPDTEEAGPYRKNQAPKKGEIPKPQTSFGARVARVVFWATWFGAVPFVFACMFVWGLTPPSGVEPGGLFGWLESFVREQPVPVGIGAFALMNVAIGFVRKRLPLASFAYPPLREDVPEDMRGPYERAAALLDEADMILATHSRAVTRDLTSKERDKLKDDLDALRETMQRMPFESESFVDALVKADGEVDVRLGRWRKSEMREYAESIFVAVGVALALRTFVVEAFKIPSGSMIPTLQVGDHIFVNKLSYGPAIPFTHTRLWTKMPPDRGDVMVFQYPEKMEQDFIKRVIAKPGDKLEAKNGHPWINGWEVPHCYVGVYSYDEPDALISHHEGDLYVEFLEDEAYLTLFDRSSGGYAEYQGPFLVKPGEVYVMGDNRNNSHDSRMWYGGAGGGVPFANIRGRALFVWLSYADQNVDWSRMGAPVMGRPRLPKQMVGLEPALTKCLRDRPAIDKTTPPNP